VGGHFCNANKAMVRGGASDPAGEHGAQLWSHSRKVVEDAGKKVPHFGSTYGST
jgi:hypothetical protein